MKASDAALLIKIPRNQTVLMQHLQLLVVRRHYWWCGGTISSGETGPLRRQNGDPLSHHAYHPRPRV